MVIRDINEVKEGITQKFFYTPLPFGSVTNNRILELIQANAITKEDVAVMKYLYQFKCAPVAYIVRDVLPKKDPAELKRKLMDLVKQRFLNAFILTDKEDQEFTTNAEVFFTVDYCAIAVLRSGLNDENLENWKGTDLFMTGLQVKKTLELIDFYKLIGDKVDYFVLSEMYKAFGAVVRTKATFKMNNTHFMVEVIDKEDVYEGSDSKLLEKILRYEQILGTDGWQNYFKEADNAPILLLLCDCVASGEVYCARIGETKIPNIRYFALDQKAWFKGDNGKLVKAGK